MFNKILNKFLLGSAVIIGLASSSNAVDDRPLVVATTSILCDLTEQIAQDTVNLQCLIGAGVDPHVYQPLPKDRQAIEKAQLILYGGYNFDESLIKLINATSNNSPKVAVFEEGVPNPLMGGEHDHGHGHEDDHGHDHGHDHEAEASVPDPHVWHDPNNGIAMVQVISKELGRLQPGQASMYQQNAESISKELTEIDNWIGSQIATIPPEKRKLVTTHDALGYYVNAYNLEFEGALSGFSTEEAPTASRVSELIKDIQGSQVTTIFAETSVNPRLLETVAREANVQVSERELYADGLGEEGTDGDTYQKMLIANTKTIVEGLGGNYQPFAANYLNQIWYTGNDYNSLNYGQSTQQISIR